MPPAPEIDRAELPVHVDLTATLALLDPLKSPESVRPITRPLIS